uniref:PRTRC system protein E n=1 Tax=Bursaphelenchus xylophilus TaxID=6326 RepID=A0A1I7SIG5_BURXY
MVRFLPLDQVPHRNYTAVKTSPLNYFQGNFAEEQADPTSPHVEIAATNPKKSDGGQSQAIYAAGSAEAETPEAAPAAEKAAEPAPAPEKAAEPAPAPKPEAKKEPAPSQAYRQARLRF